MFPIYNRKALVSIYTRLAFNEYPPESLKDLSKELASQCYDQLDTIDELQQEKADFIVRLEAFKTESLALVDRLEEEVAKLRQEHSTEKFWLEASIGHLEEWNRKLRASKQGTEEENRVLKHALEKIVI